MRNFHTLDGGKLLYIGDPPIPNSVDGYDQDTEHKELFHPSWEPCDFRTTKPFKCPRGNITQTPYCETLNEITNYQKCSDCLLPKAKSPVSK